MGRTIVVLGRMHLHLLWDNDGRIFLKPVPRHLLDPGFWSSQLECHKQRECESRRPGLNVPANDQPQDSSLYLEQCRAPLGKVALGFLYTYICLISSENDFLLANEKRLLPDEIESWAAWKKLARNRTARPCQGISRISKIMLFKQLQGFDQYLGGRHSYSAFVHDNLVWMSINTIFIALVLTARQVGLATDRLQANTAFQQASYGFTIFAMVGPLGGVGLVMLLALLKLLKVRF
ncbi:hypothetical protein ABEF95_008582 [Exophiala dermatitidis]